jgi:drug/metabolite transporter (DMT)-like permease
MQSPTNKNRAFLYASAAFLLFGSTPLIVKQSGMQTLDLVFYRMAIAGFAAFAIGRLWRPGSLNIGGRAFAGVLLTSAAIFLNMVCLFAAFRKIPVPLAVALFFSGPIFSLFIRYFAGQAALRKSDILSTVIALIGLGALALEVNAGLEPSQVLGTALALLGGFLFGLVPVFEVLTAKVPPTTTLFVQGTFAALALLPFLTDAVPLHNTQELLRIGALGAAQTLLPFLLWWRALRIKSDLSPFFAFLDPITAIVLSLLVFDETLTTNQWVCTAMLTLAVIVQVACSGRNSPSQKRD